MSLWDRIVSLRDRISLDESFKRRAVWAMEIGLIGMFFIGLDRLHIGIIVNALIGLAVTQLPPILRHDYDFPMDSGLTLWITLAVFLHALGTAGLPGTNTPFYRAVWWWDHLTHALSASVVAAAGYATIRALDVHSDEITLPPRFMFVFILMFIIAFGVLWEVLEFALSEFAYAIGEDPVLVQYGIGDTMLDLVFDMIGAVVVALWGSAHLTDVVGELVRRLDARAK